MMFLRISLIISVLYFHSANSQVSSEEENVGLHTIEGRVFPLSDYQSQWQANTRVHVNGGEYLGFVKKDGSFAVHNVPSGSHVVEILNTEYTFEPVRVEITSKGKQRARKVNNMEPNQKNQVPYPLRMKALAKTRYFQMREQWRVTDFLFNPMVLMMVLPLVLVMILPKMMNDPETKKEMEQIQNLTKFEMPQVSDMVSNYLARPSTSGTQQQQQQPKKTNKTKKKQQ